MKVVRDEVQPALVELKNYITGDYSKHTRSKEGVLSLPNGKSFYKECLTWHLETEMTPEEVHEKGLQEIKRIKSKMLEVISMRNF